MSSGLMETAPGGESDQYQSQQTVTNPHSKQGGQMGGQLFRACQSNLILELTVALDPETQVDAVDSQREEQNAARGEKTADNVRYGQNISEGGMGGKTTEAGGSANQGSGFGGTGAQLESDNADESRQESGGYGPGSGIGA